MSGRGPRWIKEIQYPVTGIEVVLSGDMDSSYGYVTINGTKYSTTQTLTLDPGTTAVVTVGTSSSTYGKNLVVTLDGETVATPTNTRNKTLTYNYQVTKPSTLEFTQRGASFAVYTTCAITTS